MYVDAIFDRRKDVIRVVERRNGQRVFKNIPANHTFYYTSPSGVYKSIFGDTLAKYSSSSYKDFTREKMFREKKSTIFESDINPVFRSLETNYLNADTPNLVLGFFDIEVDFEAYIEPTHKKVQVRHNNKTYMSSISELALIDNRAEYEIYDDARRQWDSYYDSRLTKQGRGFAPIDDPFNPVTAISIYNSKEDILHTLLLPPPTVSTDEALRIAGLHQNTHVFDSEAALLDEFLNLIDDIDVLSGWNSTGYDIPYLVGRIERVLGKDHLKRFCLWDQLPRKREFIKYGKTSFTYDIVGRVHLDYLELYQKHNPQQLHSYRLDFVGEIEVGENKTAYTGTLDDLYKKDFETFVDYNRQDTMLLVKIDRKKRFIELANQIAHANTVLLKTTMGSVALIEQSITNEAHSRGMIVPDRKKDEEDSFEDYEDDDQFYDDEEKEEETKAAVGAYVADPKVGISRMVGSVDINSLYPSVLRSLNMSPETLVGHIRPIMTDAMILERRRSGLKSAQLWEGIFNTVEFDKVHEQTDDILEVDFVDGSFLKMTAKEVYELVYNPNSKMTLTANGTIFRTDTQGVIPSLLERWYSERKILQAREKVYGHVSDEHETILKFFDNDEVKAKEFETALNAYLPNAKETSEDVGKMLKLMGAGDIESVGDLMKTHNFILENGSINAVDRTYSQTMVVFWNQRQQARKILLNSLYGALLNEVMKFYDKRIGQSVTLTGRNIVRHMNASVNEEFTGEYDYKGKAIVYADTDSVAADSIVETNIGKMTIEDLFNKSEIKWSGTDGKEYAVDNRISTLSYEPYDNTISYKPINYIYRHKVSKPKWKITDADGREVVVTDDHSIMIERGADTYEIKPSELKPGDIIITIDQK